MHSMALADIPADGFTLTHGRQPKTKDKPVIVQLRNGFVAMDHPMPADKWRWDDTGSGADIAAVRLANRGE